MLDLQEVTEGAGSGGRGAQPGNCSEATQELTSGFLPISEPAHTCSATAQVCTCNGMACMNEKFLYESLRARTIHFTHSGLEGALHVACRDHRDATRLPPVPS